MKKMRIASAIVLVIAIVCQLFPTSVFAADPEYVTKDIHIYRDSMDEDETVECRFYSDLPEIPYIDYQVYASVFLKDTITYGTADAGSVEAFSAANECSVIIDYDKDVIYFERMSDYLYAPSQESEGEEFYYLDMAAIDVAQMSEGHEATLDLGKYGIDIKEEDGKLFFPVPTLSDIYSSVNQAVVYYNGDVFYYNSVIMSGGARDQDDECLSILVKNMNRSETLANYTYEEICFNIDNFFGFPCSNSPFMDRVQEVGLDKALEEYDPLAKELLLSEKSEEHIAGLYRLFNFWLCDGGHTGAYLNDLIRTLRLDYDDYVRVVNAIRTYGMPDTDYENVYLDYNDSYYDNYMNIMFTRGNAFGTEMYNEQGDTAVISFDEFDIDFEAWENYLKNGEAIPEDSADTFAFVYSCLERAKLNPEIKNIVFDLSANGGGYIAVYIAIMSLINVTAEYNVLDRYTGEAYAVTYLADRNLDGAVDEADLEVDYSNFRFGVLTSTCSFSCGNLFPSAMKDAGFLVIGEQSGGGTCPVAYSSTAEGLEYNTSGGDSMICNAEGETIDDGVPVYENLVKYDEDGSKDYSNFFRIDILSRLMNEYYDGAGIFGDVNCDGSFDMKDVLLYRKVLAGLEKFTPEGLANADANYDGEYNMKDVLKMRKVLAGLEKYYE